MGQTRGPIRLTTISKMRAGDILMDEAVKGFGVRVQRGVPTFFVRKYAHGRQHWQTIGSLGAFTPNTARRQAIEILQEIAQGRTPTARREKLKSTPTVSEFCDQWLETYVNTKLKASTRELYATYVRLHVKPLLGKRLVDQIETSDIATWHHELRNIPATANRCLTMLASMFGHVERMGYRPRGTNPCRDIPRYRELLRKRYLTKEEIVRVGEAFDSKDVRQRHSPFVLGALLFLMFTGVRRGEALQLKWPDVDLDRGIVLLRDPKTAERSVYLSEAVKELLVSLDRIDGNEYVFPSLDRCGEPVRNIRRAWDRIRTVAGIPDVRPQDLRHTFASTAISSGASLAIVGKLLGHTNFRTTQRYAHLAEDPVRSVADSTAAQIADKIRASDRRSFIELDRYRLPSG